MEILRDDIANDGKLHLRRRGALRWTLALALALATWAILLTQFRTVYDELEPWVTFLTLLAVLITLLQLRQSQHIADSMSTQYAGVFPKNLPAIVSLLRDTSRSLLVVSDTAGYGHFSEPRIFEHYKAQLHELTSAGVDVRMLVYDEARYREANQKQLGKMSESYEEFLGSSTFAAYEKWKPRKAKLMREGPEDFYEVLVKNETETISELIDNGAKVDRTDQHLPIYMWISDGEKAVFGFVVNEAGEDLEYTFTSRDRNLIRALRTMSRAYMPSSMRKDDPAPADWKKGQRESERRRPS